MTGKRLEEFCAPLSVDLLVYKGEPGGGYRVERGAGTIIHRKGYILAAYHATSHGHMHIMFTHDGRSLDKTKRGFRLVGRASDYDTALVKMERDRTIQAARIGRDSDIGVGGQVLMIGNPGGKSHTIHHAEVIDMNAEGGRMVVQGSEVNPGDSGGSVFNNRGELVGMIQLKLLGVGLEKTGAAIRIDHLRHGFDKVLADEKNHDYKLGLKVDMYGPAKVTHVRPGSPAAKAGIEVDDVIRMVGDMKIDDGMHYVCAVYDIDSTLHRLVKFERDDVTYGVLVTPEGPENLRAREYVKGLSRGLKCTVYSGRWNKLPDFSELTPEGIKTVAKVGLQAAPAKRNEFGLVFEGYINIPRDGKWTFYTRSDDGSKLWIGDQLVVKNDFLHSAALEQSGTILLQQGWHRIKLQYFDCVGPEALSMLAAGPEATKQEVPSSVLGFKP